MMASKYFNLSGAIFFFFIATTTNGFIYWGSPDGNKKVSESAVWTSRKVVFRFNPDQTTLQGAGATVAPDLTAAQFRQAFSDAVDAWDAVCDSDIELSIGSDTTANGANSADLISSVSWDNNTVASGNSQFSSQNTLAHAVSVTLSNNYLECDIVVNGDASGTFGVGGEASYYDLVGILVHEIGHCLGLGHSINPPTYTSTNWSVLNASMRAAVSAGDTSVRTITRDDNDGVSCIYQNGKTLREGEYCTSYHGTNGGGALSGTVSGGPSSEAACSGNSEVTVISKGTKATSGCSANAVTVSTLDNESEEASINEMFLIVLLVGAYLLKRLMKCIFQKLFLS